LPSPVTKITSSKYTSFFFLSYKREIFCGAKRPDCCRSSKTPKQLYYFDVFFFMNAKLLEYLEDHFCEPHHEMSFRELLHKRHFSFSTNEKKNWKKIITGSNGAILASITFFLVNDFQVCLTVVRKHADLSTKWGGFFIFEVAVNSKS